MSSKQAKNLRSSPVTTKKGLRGYMERIDMEPRKRYLGVLSKRYLIAQDQLSEQAEKQSNRI